MSTVFSTLSLNHNYGTEDFHANHQENHQIYSSIFRDAANSPYHKDLDFDLSDVISKALNSLKGNYQSKSCSKQANIRNPCGICCKSVNKNQHGIFCTTCLKWYHRKCNGTSLKDYESLRNEGDDIPWQCILCLIDDNKLKNVLHASKIIFDFIGVSETKQLINKDFISNVDIEGYQVYSQPSKSASGGVAI